MTDTSINPDGTRTVPAQPFKHADVPKDEAWFAEAKRLNDLLVDLAPQRRSPGKEREDDTPKEILDIVHMQQEGHLGGVAKPARGWVPGTLKNPHGREKGRFGGTDPWKILQSQSLADPAFKPYLENRAARRKWRKINPFSASKKRLRNPVADEQHSVGRRHHAQG